MSKCEQIEKRLAKDYVFDEAGDVVVGWHTDMRWLLSEIATLKQALTLIGDIGYDYDGYGTPDDLEKLIDEMVGYARNPQSAVDVLTAEESGR